MKIRLDQELVRRGLMSTRSQAETYIKRGQVKVGGQVVQKPNYQVNNGQDKITCTAGEQYVSRAGLKLASVATELGLDFRNKIILDVGSSTGGFTDYALKHGATKVIAVDVGTNQLHPSLRTDTRIELHEQTDIRDVRAESREQRKTEDNLVLISTPDIVLIDVSFVSLREILPSVSKLCTDKTQIVAMVKPQFEAGQSDIKHKGVIKNVHIRRDIIKAFEQWVVQVFVISDKADSKAAGEKGNQERFYVLHKA